MKLICVFVYVFCVSIYVFAQKNDIDSVQNMLKSHQKKDSTQVNLLINLAYLYQSSAPDTAMQLCKKALQVAEALNYTQGKAKAMHRLGHILWLKAKYPLTTNYALKSLRLFEELGDSTGIANCHNLIANTYNMSKEYAKAMEHYQKSVIIFEAMNDSVSIGRAYANIGRTYYINGQYPQATVYLKKALYLLALTTEKNTYAAALNTLGDVYQKVEQYKESLSCYTRSLAISEPLQSKRIITYSTHGISQVYQKWGQIQKSNQYAEKTFNIAKDIGYRENIKNAAFILSENYRILQKYKEALHFYTIGKVESDSMFGAETKKQVETLHINYQLEKTQKEMSLLIIEQQLQKQKNNALVLGILLIFMVLLLFYVNLRWLKKDKKILLAQSLQLQQQKEEMKTMNDHLESIVADRTYELNMTIENLTKQNQDLQHFSYIVSHNLRAPVARIQGLVNIFNQEDMNDEFNKQILNHLHTSSHDLDEVIRDLTTILSINKTMLIKERVNLNEIISMELSYLDEQIKETKADIIVDFSVVRHIYTAKVYIQSIIHNLLSNAIKYHSPKRIPIIEVKSAIENNFICLSFKDNGLGVDSGDLYKIFGLYQRMHTHVEGKGLGLYLVKSQVEAINGKIELESKLDEGSVFRVYMPYA